MPDNVTFLGQELEWNSDGDQATLELMRWGVGSIVVRERPDDAPLYWQAFWNDNRYSSNGSHGMTAQQALRGLEMELQRMASCLKTVTTQHYDLVEPDPEPFDPKTAWDHLNENDHDRNDG